jgi:hypothetical protein
VARRVILLLLLLVTILVVAFMINSARAFRDRVFADARADTIIKFTTESGDIEEMTWRAFVLKHVARKQLNAFSFWLVNQPVKGLWGTVFALTGLAGGCIYLLLIIIEPGVVGRQAADADVALQPGRLLARLTVAAAAGLLAFFVLLLPASLAIVPLKIVGAAESDVYASLLLLPAAAGIFSATFFEKVRVWLDRVLTRKADGQAHERTNGGPKK